MARLKEAAAPAPQLRFTDIELLLRQHLNCTQEEFREAWQGGYDRCEQQQQQLQQLLQGGLAGGAAGAEQQQKAVFYVHQLEDRISAKSLPQDDSHAAAAAAAEAMATDPAAAAAHAAVGDDSKDAGVKQRQYFTDPLAGPSLELAPPGEMHKVPVIESKSPALIFWVRSHCVLCICYGYIYLTAFLCTAAALQLFLMPRVFRLHPCHLSS